MKRNTILKILNPVLGILLLNQIVTGLLRDAFSDKTFEIVHVGGGVVFVALAILHLLLNWSWVRANYLKRAPVAKAQVPDGGVVPKN